MNGQFVVACRAPNCKYTACPSDFREASMAMAAHTLTAHGVLALANFVTVTLPEIPEAVDPIVPTWFYPVALRCGTCQMMTRSDIPVIDPEHGAREVAITCGGCGEVVWGTLRVTPVG